MRTRYCVLVGHDDEVYAVGSFANKANALAYADGLPSATVRGLARIATTEMFRVETGHVAPVWRRTA